MHLKGVWFKKKSKKRTNKKKINNMVVLSSSGAGMHALIRLFNCTYP